MNKLLAFAIDYVTYNGRITNTRTFQALNNASDCALDSVIRSLRECLAKLEREQDRRSNNHNEEN